MASVSMLGGCEKYGPFLGTLNIRGRITMGIPKGTKILTTTLLCSHSFCFAASSYARLSLGLYRRQLRPQAFCPYLSRLDNPKDDSKQVEVSDAVTILRGPQNRDKLQMPVSTGITD